MSHKSSLCADNPVSPLMETSLWDCDIWLLLEIFPYWGIITNTGDVVNTTYNPGLWLVNTSHVTSLLASDWSILVTWPEFWPLIGPPTTLHPWHSDVCPYLQNVGSIFLGWIKMCCLIVWWGHTLSASFLELISSFWTNQRPVLDHVLSIHQSEASIHVSSLQISLHLTNS